MKNNPEKIKARLFVVVLAGLGLVACGGGGSSGNAPAVSANASSTARTSLIQTGDADCPSGGILVETGIDDNANGVLDSNEVDNREKVCNGAVSLININPEPVGNNCVTGGVRIETGIDINNNNILEAAEITQTAFTCNGENASGWQLARKIDSSDFFLTRDVRIAGNGRGEVIAVWQDYNGSNYDIWSNRYVAGAGWGTAEIIDTATASSYSPEVAIDSSGNAVAVWYQYGSTVSNIMSNRYIAGVGWGTAQLIETDDAGDAIRPKVAVDNNGNALVVWDQSDGVRSNIWSNRYTAGTGWGVAQLLETDDTGGAAGQQVAMNSSGNALVVWNQFDGTRNNIWSRSYTNGSGWGVTQMIEADNADAYAAKIAINDSGKGVAIWTQSDGTAASSWANNFDGSNWATAQTIETENTPIQLDDSQVAIDANGNALAVWLQRGSSGYYSVMSNRYLTGSGWLTAQLVEMDETGDASFPQLSMNANGQGIVIWQQDDGAYSSIFASLYIAGIGWDTVARVETDDANANLFPDITIDDNAEVVAAWIKDSVSSGLSVFANNYELK